ncbi:phosphotransferase enzyme family protein [Seiridium cupressi]
MEKDFDSSLSADRAPDIEVVPGCSFLKQQRGLSLPTPAEVRALNLLTGDIRADDWNRPPPVVVESLGLIVKYGGDVTLIEVQTQMMAREQLKDKVPIPEVFGWTQEDDQTFIYMELIKGDPLCERWPDMIEDERLAVCDELRLMVKSWSTLKQDGHDQLIGSLGKKPLNEVLIRDRPNLTGPYMGANALQQFQDRCRIEISVETLIKFTHADLVPLNILLSRGQNPKVAAVIDWGQAGWYPAYWEYCKAYRITVGEKHFDKASQEEWHEKYLPHILAPVEKETIYYPWLRFILANI